MLRALPGRMRQGMVNSKAELGQFAGLRGRAAHRRPRTLFATLRTNPDGLIHPSALRDANVVLHAVDLNLFQPFPCCTETTHDILPNRAQARHIDANWRVSARRRTTFALWGKPYARTSSCYLQPVSSGA